MRLTNFSARESYAKRKISSKCVSFEYNQHNYLFVIWNIMKWLPYAIGTIQTDVKKMLQTFSCL